MSRAGPTCLPALIATLLALNVAVIVRPERPPPSPSRRRQRRSLVMIAVGDPVGQVLWPLLNDPGGNISGLISMSMEWTRNVLNCSRKCSKHLNRRRLVEECQPSASTCREASISGGTGAARKGAVPRREEQGILAGMDEIAGNLMEVGGMSRIPRRRSDVQRDHAPSGPLSCVCLGGGAAAFDQADLGHCATELASRLEWRSSQHDVVLHASPSAPG